VLVAGWPFGDGLGEIYTLSNKGGKFESKCTAKRKEGGGGKNMKSSKKGW